MTWHQVPELRPSLFSEKCIQPRPLTQTLIALIGLASGPVTIGFFNFGLNKWTYKPCSAPTISRDRLFGTTVLNGKLIIAGGCCKNVERTFNTVDCLDLDSLQWTTLNPMQSNRYNFGMATLDESMYVFGGLQTERRSIPSTVNSIEKWDPITKNWSYVSVQNLEYDYTTQFNLFKLQTKLCIQVQNHAGQTVFHLYDVSAESLQTNWWTCDSTLLGAGTVISNQKEEFFITVSRDSVFKIHLQDNSRETIPIDPPISAEYTQCSMFGDQVIIFGDNKFIVYYPFTNSWRIIPDLENALGRVVLVSNF